MWKIAILAALLFPSCKYFDKHVNPDAEIHIPVARVGNSYLYYSDIKPILKSAAGSTDSARMVESYIDEWVKRKLMIEKALLYLPPEKINIDRQVEDYRESLILYIYEKELILQKLDTTIDENALLSYYEEYKTNFELKNDVLQMYYVKAPRDAPKIDSLVLWIASRREENKVRMQDYCQQYASDFSLSDTLWYELPEVLRNIPISPRQLETISRYKTTAMISDSLYHYVVKANDYKAKGTVAPFYFVKSDIARILLNKRKKELVRSTVENVYLEGKRNKRFEVYNNK